MGPDADVVVVGELDIDGLTERGRAHQVGEDEGDLAPLVTEAPGGLPEARLELGRKVGV